MKVHQEQITNQHFQVVVNNPSNKIGKIYGLFPKKCNGPTYDLRSQKIFDQHKPKTKRFADTGTSAVSELPVRLKAGKIFLFEARKSYFLSVISGYNVK